MGCTGGEDATERGRREPLSQQQYSYFLRWVLGIHESYLCNCFVVQLLNLIQLFGTPWTAAHQASLSFTISWSLLKLMSVELVIQPSNPLLSPSPPALNLSQYQILFQ